MKIGDKLSRLLSKKYLPDQIFDQKFERYDIRFKTDGSGDPKVLFIGKLGPNGLIRGERFVRVMVRGTDGKILKEHWDAKGKV